MGYIKLIFCLFILFFMITIANTEEIVSGEIETLGIPSKIAGFFSPYGPNWCYVVGPDNKTVYVCFGQEGNPCFIIAVSTDGKTVKYTPPKEIDPVKISIPWAFIYHPDVQKMYMGTTNGGYILCFDPKDAEKQIQSLGQPIKTETYIWSAIIGNDGTIYFATYPNCKLLSLNPYTNEFIDLGRAHSVNKYLRTLAVHKTGNIYIGTGIDENDVIVYDIKSKTFNSILPPELKSSGFSIVMNNEDGDVIAKINGKMFLVDDDGKLVEGKYKSGKYTKFYPTTLEDGRKVTAVGLDGTLSIIDTSTTPAKIERKKFDYSGDGIKIFAIEKGPDGNIYGSTILPLAFFCYNIKSDIMKQLGIISGGEIYSFTNYKTKLFFAVYPNGKIFSYYPDKPWSLGSKPENNPRQITTLGSSFVRPKTMFNWNDKIVVAGIPDYGAVNSGVAVIDPETESVISKYDNVISSQSINCMIYDSNTKLCYGGTKTGIGSRTPLVKTSTLFAYDIINNKIVWQTEVSTNPVVTISSLILNKDNKIVGLYRCSGIAGLLMFVYDINKNMFVFNDKKTKIKYDVGTMKYSEKNDKIYATSGREIIEINDVTFDIKILKLFDHHAMSTGFVLDNGYIYISDEAKLCRIKLE